MTTYIVTTTPVQDAALNLLVADLNFLRGRQDPPAPPVLVGDYVLARLAEVLASYSEQYAPRILALAQSTYPTLSEDQRGQLLTLLGRPAFASLPPEDQLAALVALGPTDFRLLPPERQGLILQVLGLLPPSPGG